MSNILHESAEEEGTGGVHHSVTDEDVAHAGHAQRAAYVRLEPHNVMHQYTTNWRIICATIGTTQRHAPVHYKLENHLRYNCLSLARPLQGSRQDQKIKRSRGERWSWTFKLAQK